MSDWYQQMRDAFDKKQSQRGVSATYAGDGQYEHFATQREWMDWQDAWQAALAASQTCVAKPELPKTWWEQLGLPRETIAFNDEMRAMSAEIAELRAALSASGKTAQAAMSSPFEDSTRIEDLKHANENMHRAMQEQSELVGSLTRELNEMKLRASFAALPVGKRVLVDSAPQPSQVSEQDKLDAERLRKLLQICDKAHVKFAQDAANKINGVTLTLKTSTDTSEGYRQRLRDMIDSIEPAPIAMSAAKEPK